VIRRLLILLALLLPLAAGAAVHRIPGTHASLDAAMHAGAFGDTFYLMRGDSTYVLPDTLYVHGGGLLATHPDIVASTGKATIRGDNAGLDWHNSHGQGLVTRDIRFTSTMITGGTYAIVHVTSNGVTPQYARFERCDWFNCSKTVSGEACYPAAVIAQNMSGGDSLVFVDCTWDSCTVTADADKAALGGAVKLDNVLLAVFRNCIFSNNSVSGKLGGVTDVSGGAVYSAGFGANVARFRNCLFTGNSATDNGAAIGGTIVQVTTPNASLELINCTFDGNAGADSTAGVIYMSEGISNADIDVKRSIFSGNTGLTPFHADTEIDSLLHCDAYGNRLNSLAFGVTGTATDTLHIDPKYNSTALAATGYYQARDARLVFGPSGLGYWGWEQWPGPPISVNSYTTENIRRSSHFRRRGH